MKSTPRTILVTGAGSGLGRGLCECLAGQGHRIMATDLKPEGVEETVNRVTGAGGNATGFVLDVTSQPSIQNVIDQLEQTPVDVLINNAGLQHVARLEDFSAEKWELLTNVMLGGVFRMSQAVLPGMRTRGYGRIIQIGSIHSLVASPYKSAYTAAKHALLGFSKVLALETADCDITCNTICPAYIRTPLVDAQIRDQAKTRAISESEVIDKVMLAPMPKKTFITVEEIAGTIEFLIGPWARNITGQAITIDGGWTAQ